MIHFLRPRTRPGGFALLDLLFCFLIATMMFTLLLPAIQVARTNSQRYKCTNNLRLLAHGHLSYAYTQGGFMPMAKFWWNVAMPGQSPGYLGAYPTPGPGGWYDDYGWYFSLMPYIGQGAVLTLGDLDQPLSRAANHTMRTTPVAIHACPSDLGLQGNELNSQIWSRLRGNYLVNAGNTVYGQYDLNAPCPGQDGSTCWFGGAPFGPIEVTPLARITDGLNRTLMMSEALVLPETAGWGGPYSENQSAIGGQMFTGWHTPNSAAPDALARIGEWIGNSREGFLQQGIPLPIATAGRPCGTGGRAGATVEGVPSPTATQDSNGIKEQCIAARSHHPGGVNAALCSGSVKFFSDSIDRTVWHAFTTAWAGDPKWRIPRRGPWRD